MIPINRTFAPLQALVDELARCGMRHAVTCPGSRNAPIALTLAAEERIDAVSVIDERSAGFMALGMAKASGRPVAVTCTSGTAAANLAPRRRRGARGARAADRADRRPAARAARRGRRAGDRPAQALRLGGQVVRGGRHPRARARRPRCTTARSACRAYWTAAAAARGRCTSTSRCASRWPRPRRSSPPDGLGGPADGRPWTEVREHRPAPDADDVQELAERMAAAPRGVIVCGADARGRGRAGGPAGRRRRAGRCWPSRPPGCAAGAHDRSHVVAHYDVLLRGERFAAGARARSWCCAWATRPPRSRCAAWLAGARRSSLDPHGAWHEPTRAAELMLRAAAAPGLRRAGRRARDAHGRARRRTGSARGGRRTRWCRPRSRPRPIRFEPQASTPRSSASLPDDALVWVSSSMPVRDVEAFFPQRAERLRFLANRGANGIDGVVSSRRRRGARPPGRPTVCCSRRAGAAARPRRPAGRPPRRARPDDRLREQRRRRDLRLPARGRAREPRGLRAAHRHARRGRLAAVAALGGHGAPAGVDAGRGARRGRGRAGLMEVRTDRARQRAASTARSSSA